MFLCRTTRYPSSTINHPFTRKEKRRRCLIIFILSPTTHHPRSGRLKRIPVSCRVPFLYGSYHQVPIIRSREGRKKKTKMSHHLHLVLPAVTQRPAEVDLFTVSWIVSPPGTLHHHPRSGRLKWIRQMGWKGVTIHAHRGAEVHPPIFLYVERDVCLIRT